MGGSSSKNNTEIINDTVQRVIFETIQNCKGPINQQQVIEIKDSKNIFISDVEMDQYASINLKCVSDAMKSTDFSNKLDAALKQMAESKTSGLGFGSSSSKNASKITNKLTQEVKDTMSQECAIAISQQQAIIIDSSENAVVQNVSFNQNASAYIDCLQKSESYNKSVNDLDIFIDQNAKAERSGILDLGLGFDLGIPGLGGAGGIAGSSISSSICLCIILVIMFLVPKFRKKG